MPGLRGSHTAKLRILEGFGASCAVRHTSVTTEDFFFLFLFPVAHSLSLQSTSAARVSPDDVCCRVGDRQCRGALNIACGRSPPAGRAAAVRQGETPDTPCRASALDGRGLALAAACRGCCSAEGTRLTAHRSDPSV